MNRDKEIKINTLLTDLQQTETDIDISNPKLISSLQTFVNELGTQAESQVEPDFHFTLNLRSQLMTDFEHEKKNKSSVKSPYVFLSRINIKKIPEKVLSGATGALIALIVAIPATYALTSKLLLGTLQSPLAVKDLSSALTQEQQINDKGTNAFGTLALLPQAASTTQAQTATTAPGVQTAATTSSGEQGTTSSAMIQTSTSETTPTYIYAGNSLPLNSATGIVYKRNSSLDAGQPLITMLQSLNFGLTNISSFPDLNIKNLDFSEPGDQGYTIHVDFTTGTLSITAKGFDLSHPGSQATSSLPDDQTLIKATNEFLTEHSITTSAYAAPYVESGTSNIATVIYPLQLHGQDVYDALGNRYGLEVLIDADNHIEAVLNLTSQAYDSSNYSLETNPDHILTQTSEASTSVNSAVKLSTPHQVLMRYNDLYIPALLFPVADKNSNQNPVIVPLLSSNTLDQSAKPVIHILPVTPTSSSTPTS